MLCYLFLGFLRRFTLFVGLLGLWRVIFLSVAFSVSINKLEICK